MLKHMHVPVRPAGEDAYYKPGFKRSLCAALMFVLCKTQLGEWAASAHCRNASDEMLALYRQWETMRPTGYAMPHWDNICQSLAAMEKNQ
jgi:2-dehydropantoate 2-reductase